MKNVSILIREARAGDFEWISNLMRKALEPYYGGDHGAHARRIFEAHINGGHDQIGFFSFEQKMFIAETNGIKAGIIHLVGKRQSTYKISPLIVSPELQGKIGIGSKLFEYAEEYVRGRNARQIYCTVAEKNIVAMQFFLRKGFIKAGSSDSHYKNDMTEIMLYKPLYKISMLSEFDKMHISVLPLDDANEKIKGQITNMLLEKLPHSFEGIENKWIEALFAGYSRRHTSDVNAKYKLIFVALSKGKVIGIAAATPKKGNPIKIMPFIANDMLAFEALLIDIPYQLSSYGHKLYLHIAPTAEEVVSLQRLGWHLDAAMPSAYRLGVVTQQWSLNLNKGTGEIMRTMRVKQRFFNLIKSGKKNLEVRVLYDSIKRIQPGESIRLMSNTSNFDVKVAAVRRYKTFEEMLKAEPYDRIVPDSSSKEEVLSLLKEIYPPEKERLGVVVLELSKAQ